MKYSFERVKSILNKFIDVNSIELLGSGNHSEAFCINNDIVVKIPKHKKASDCLKTEIKVLTGLQGRLSVDIPSVLFSGEFDEQGETFVFFASKIVAGKKLSRQEFLSLPSSKLKKNAEIIARFLIELHSQKDILAIKRKDLYLLHGDFSLNHVRFDGDGIVCGVLDFGDSRVGKYKSDLIYLLGSEDEEEFGIEFGELVLNNYEIMKG